VGVKDFQRISPKSGLLRPAANIGMVPRSAFGVSSREPGVRTAVVASESTQKRHENALRIGTFWHQIGGDRYDFGWLIFRFDQERLRDGDCALDRLFERSEFDGFGKVRRKTSFEALLNIVFHPVTTERYSWQGELPF
jgi:hypothetical protein